MDTTRLLERIKNRSKYTIIIGCGRLGASIAGELSDKGENVLIIDQDDRAFRRLTPNYGGIALKGDGCEIQVLKEARIDKATSVIVVTNNDNTNVMIAQIARELFHVDNVVARLYDPERACVYEELDINTICPTTLSTGLVEQWIHSA